MTLNVSSEDLDLLKEALVRGEREVSINDKRIVYRSVTELQAAITDIEKRLLRAQAKRGKTAPITRQIHLNGSKGF